MTPIIINIIIIDIPLLIIIILIVFTIINHDLSGVKVARDVGVGDIFAVDQLAQEERVGVWEVSCLKYLVRWIV